MCMRSKLDEYQHLHALLFPLIQSDCRYYGVRDDDGEYTKLFYEIVMGKLAFFIVFEV